MVNEFCYCPRLFYLEYVQQEWAHNADTLEGRLVHRRVDRQQGDISLPQELEDQEKIHARSVLVGSDRLGAIARIDLVEMEDGALVPVDYKRGSPPPKDRAPEGAYEPDRVQLCLQGLLLREEDYRVDHGIIYFAETRTRVRIDFTDELIARTLSLLEQARQVARSGQIPPPLVDSPKCPRCSLVGICLPDETNLLGQELRENQTTEISKKGSSVRRLFPARDEHLAVYVQGQGHTVGLKGEALEIRNKGEIVATVRLIDISHLVLFGNVQVSTQALRRLMERDSVIVHLSYGGWLIGITTPPSSKNIELRLRQFSVASDKSVSSKLAKAFVSGKIRNSRTLLRRNARELPKSVLKRLAELGKKAENAESIDELLGIEGAAAHEYFSHFSLMFKRSGNSIKEDFGASNDSETSLPVQDSEVQKFLGFDFNSRNRRPPRDPVNAMLSFLYTMLLKDILVTLVGIGFDPYLGFYHQPKYGKPALALDLMEEFRSIIADSVAIGLINNGEIRPSDFVTRAGAAALTDEGKRKVIEAYERRLNTLIKHPLFKYPISYRRIFEVQARLLARFLMGEIPHYPPFCTR
ncbi:MAG: CRISPR-associated endonuclease Cas1 [Acidobacteria bacterium]|jgi:CRISPR-associated protein Cas1|nr:MAG: CRISPR-associated endonuclease Cas1 [Acidobacteriota bacterium]